jgi:putative ABC transport system permease protein
MVVAIAVSLVAVAAVLSARSILTREIAGNYLSTHPASATLDLPGGLDRAAVDAIRAEPGVTDATMRRVVRARIQLDGRWQQLLLFVIAADDPLRISGFHSGQQQWPPATDALLLERSTLSYFRLDTGSSAVVQTPNGAPQQLTVAGVVHDPSLSPSQQETVGYGYLTPTAMQRLGETTVLNQLKIIVGDVGQPSSDTTVIERAAQRVATTLAARGTPVERIEIPPPYQHPHQSQMKTVTTLLLAFGLMSLLLSAILVATMMNGLLAQQVRQIGVMKAVGARTSQILRLYLLMTLLIAVVATALAVYPGIELGRVLAATVSRLLNIDLVSVAVPGWVYATMIAAGLVIPQAVALIPLMRGSRITVRQAIDDHGTGPVVVRVSRFGRAPRANRSLVLAWRNMFRRKARFVLSLGLLAAAGGMFITGLNTANGWNTMVEQGLANRHYDLEVRLNTPVSASAVQTLIAGVPGVAHAEAWASRPAEITNPTGVDVTHSYPDGGHGSFTITAVPPHTELLRLPLRSGRWLRPDDTNAVVVNQLVAPYQGHVEVGEEITLTVAGRSTGWQVVGTVSDFGTHGTAYVTETGFAAATATSGQAQLIRIATSQHDDTSRLRVLNQVEQILVGSGISVRSAMPVTQLESALDGHVAVLIATLLALAAVMAVVGLLGLAAAMSTNVTERTRELAIMHTIGATHAAVRSIVLSEGIFTAATSILIAVLAAAPLTLLLGDFIGNQAFHLPLPFQMSAPAVLLWTTVALVGAAIATLAAARRASRLTVREALTVN